MRTSLLCFLYRGFEIIVREVPSIYWIYTMTYNAMLLLSLWNRANSFDPRSLRWRILLSPMYDTKHLENSIVRHYSVDVGVAEREEPLMYEKTLAGSITIYTIHFFHRKSMSYTLRIIHWTYCTLDKWIAWSFSLVLVLMLWNSRLSLTDFETKTSVRETYQLVLTPNNLFVLKRLIRGGQRFRAWKVRQARNNRKSTMPFSRPTYNRSAPLPNCCLTNIRTRMKPLYLLIPGCMQYLMDFPCSRLWAFDTSVPLPSSQEAEKIR